MAKEKPIYEVNDEFNSMAAKIVQKYPEKFVNIEVDKICCVNITNKDRQSKGEIETERIWKLGAVKMPVKLHCPYSLYVVLYKSDWESLGEKHKLVLVSDVLHGVSTDNEDEGKINGCDTKGYHSMFATFGLDFLTDPKIPHLLEEDIDWK
jgi:hypothetical protein